MKKVDVPDIWLENDEVDNYMKLVNGEVKEREYRTRLWVRIDSDINEYIYSLASALIVYSGINLKLVEGNILLTDYFEITVSHEYPIVTDVNNGINTLYGISDEKLAMKYKEALTVWSFRESTDIADVVLYVVTVESSNRGLDKMYDFANKIKPGYRKSPWDEIKWDED